MISDGIAFQLDATKAYIIFFHDENYYLLASNPLVFPTIWKEYKVKLYSEFENQNNEKHKYYKACQMKAAF